MNNLKTPEAKRGTKYRYSHRTGWKGFSFGSSEEGYMDTGVIPDTKFPPPLRDALLAKELTKEHRRLPNSGWITFHGKDEVSEPRPPV